MGRMPHVGNDSIRNYLLILSPDLGHLGSGIFIAQGECGLSRRLVQQKSVYFFGQHANTVPIFLKTSFFMRMHQ